MAIVATTGSKRNVLQERLGARCQRLKIYRWDCQMLPASPIVLGNKRRSIIGSWPMVTAEPTCTSQVISLSLHHRIAHNNMTSHTIRHTGQQSLAIVSVNSRMRRLLHSVTYLQKNGLNYHPAATTEIFQVFIPKNYVLSPQKILPSVKNMHN